MKKSLIIPGISLVGGSLAAAKVVGSSAATIMSVTSGTTGAALAGLFGASGTTGAAAISSGLATIGGVVGGGMAAGAIITKAVTFGAIGAGVYGIIKVLDR
ncbi:hypothetical protein [Cetobacterium sp.]|uniref:hypothetical protein n=1 Tax=Cetobacterium sp. TaxID=2071632 RepID=UPI003F3983A7